jgi:phosphoenolpyruvate-protein kinase (PTS system EI component)
VEGRASNHELDHVVPAHWPANLADAADKIESRLQTLRAADEPQTRKELAEIVDWLPQIAADTPMREQTWQPIHDTCLRANKQINDRQQFAEVDKQLQELCARLRTIHRELEVEP